LRKKELRYLAGKKTQGGLTILPISVYTKGSFIKVKLILAKGKKQFDKRSDLKKRDLDKQIRQSLKTRRNA
jgi:SsrA-binding protein